MNVVGWTLAILGSGTSLISLVALLRANESERIPYWSNPNVMPRGSLALRSIATVCLIFAAVALALASPNTHWFVALPALVLLPPGMVMIPIHNHRVDKSRLREQ